MRYSLFMRRSIEIGALVGIVALALLARVDETRKRREAYPPAFRNEEILFLNLDGYYHARLARDLVRGEYDRTDELRRVPDGAPRPWPPPLLSALIAAPVTLGVPFESSALSVPLLFGLLAALPAWALGRRFGGPAGGMTAAFFTLFSEYSFSRTGVGWLDTDGGNVFFTLAAAYFFLRFGTDPPPRRYAHLVAAIATTALFLSWWVNAPFAVAAATLPGLVVALLFFPRPGGRGGWALGAASLLALLCLFALFGPDLPGRIAEGIRARALEIGGAGDGFFPGVGVTIVELRRAPVVEIMNRTAGNAVPFAAALLGLLLLVRRKGREALFLAAPAALGLLPFFAGVRFLIFTGPVLGIGAGFLIHRAAALRARFLPPRALAALLTLLFFLPPLARSRSATYRPLLTAPYAEGLDRAGEVLPPGSILWAWWDDGYPIQYRSGLRTVTDGGAFPGERGVWNGHPYAEADERGAANGAVFFAVRGAKGTAAITEFLGGDRARALRLTREALRAGPEGAAAILGRAGFGNGGDSRTVEEWIRFLFPRPEHPVHILFHTGMIETAHWWYYLGAWDPDSRSGTHPLYAEYRGVERRGGRIAAEGLEIDVEGGRVRLSAAEGEETTRTLGALFVHGEEEPWSREYGTPLGWTFDFFPRYRYGVLAGPDVGRSLFHRIFVRGDYDGRRFRPVVDRFPFYRIASVRGDGSG